MSYKTINNKEGHWILARMGKKVLRPGGKELTMQMIDKLNISHNDDVVEFAPGLGFSANISLKKNPKSYTGVELNDEAAERLQKKITGENRKIILGAAENSSLDGSAYHKVYNEAILTMQSDKKKAEIIKEAYRILKPEGLYGVHEIGLIPNDISEELKVEIKRELARVIKVNARPLTIAEWTGLMEKEGFEVVYTATNPFHLLEPARIIEDEGFGRTLKIVFNILTHKYERKRILAMRKVFRKYEAQMNSVVVIARKKKPKKK